MSGEEAAKTLGSTDGDKGGTPTPSAPQGDEATSAALTPEATEAIAVRLRAVYSEMLNAPLPDRFSKLLAELSESEVVPRDKG